jgi:hypothetical protein
MFADKTLSLASNTTLNNPLCKQANKIMLIRWPWTQTNYLILYQHGSVFRSTKPYLLYIELPHMYVHHLLSKLNKSLQCITVCKNFWPKSALNYCNNKLVHYQEHHKDYVTAKKHINSFSTPTQTTNRLWRAGYTPADRLTSWGVLHHPFTVPVYKLLFISQ